jgi:hypothetical protein
MPQDRHEGSQNPGREKTTDPRQERLKPIPA